jgi:hypothetical protein
LSENKQSNTARPTLNASLPALGLSALGVVFGDIGTSPLYTLKTVFALTGEKPDPIVTLGVLSLVIWTLIVVTTVKYVSFAMRVDNDGEGGILALMALLGVKREQRPIIVAVGLFGAALIYGDGAITPAISVLSALEGLNIVTPVFQAYVLPAAVVILIALFAIQPQGTARIGRAFGPFMALWFLTLAALGIGGLPSIRLCWLQSILVMPFATCSRAIRAAFLFWAAYSYASRERRPSTPTWDTSVLGQSEWRGPRLYSQAWSSTTLAKPHSCSQVPQQRRTFSTSCVLCHSSFP